MVPIMTSSPSSSVINRLIEICQDGLEHFNFKEASFALKTKSPTSSNLQFLLERMDVLPLEIQRERYDQSVMERFARDVRVWVVQTSSQNATLTVQSLPNLLTIIRNSRDLDNEPQITIHPFSWNFISTIVTVFGCIILVTYTICRRRHQLGHLVATFLRSVGLAATITKDEQNVVDIRASYFAFTPATVRRSGNMTPSTPNPDEVIQAGSLIHGLSQHLADVVTVQQSTAHTIVALKHALDQSIVGYELSALASVDRSSPVASELRTALTERADATTQATLARDEVTGCGEKKIRLAEVERTLRDLRTQLETQGVEKHTLREELKTIHEVLRSLRTVARGQGAGRPVGTDELATLRASTEAKTQALIDLECSQEQLRTQRGVLEGERLELQEEVRLLHARCDESEVAERAAVQRAEEAMHRLTAAEEHNATMLSAVQQHGAEVGRLQGDLQLAERRVLRAVMEGEEMHIKLLACEALLAGTAEDRARWVGELSAKEEELVEARRLAEASLGADGADMVSTIVDDCVALLAHIATAKAKICPVADRNVDRGAAGADAALATPGGARSPSSCSDSPTSLHLSQDVLSLRTKLQSLRQANRSLSDQYEAVRAQVTRQVDATEQQQAELEALQGGVLREESLARQLRSVKDEAMKSEERIEELKALVAQREGELESVRNQVRTRRSTVCLVPVQI